MPKVNKDLGWGGTDIPELGRLLTAVVDDLNTLKTAIVQLQGLVAGANASTTLTLTK